MVDEALLARLLDEPWFALPPPKSTGRDQFQLQWLRARLGGQSPADVQATLCELSAATVAENRVHVHDFHATILHLLGLDHKKLTFRFQGRDFRLTDVHGHVIEKLLA